tara:strand:+ start:861 stop:1892 length:1032 start_codon:yes stop_codon:yes gene_type:complete
MQNILKRPMFRKGGLSTTTRTGYSEAGSAIADAKELMEIENMRDPFSDFDMSEETIKETIKEKSQPKSREELMRIAMQDTGIMDQFIKPKKDRRLANLALRFGAGLADPNLRGSFLQKVAQAGAGAVPGLIKETDAMDSSAAGVDALKMKRFLDIYDREELRNYKQSQAEDGIDDQETAFIKNIGFATESLYPGSDFAELADDEKQKVMDFVNGTLGNDTQQRTDYLNDIYKITEKAPDMSDYDDDVEGYVGAVAGYDNKRRKKARARQIHDGLLASGKIKSLDISTVAIFDNPNVPVQENVLYEIAMDMKAPEGARYFYRDRDDATNVQQTIYLDSGFNPII